MTVEIFEKRLCVEIEMATIDLCSESELERELESDSLSDFGSVATEVSVQFVQETKKRVREELEKEDDLSITSESTAGDDVEQFPSR